MGGGEMSKVSLVFSQVDCCGCHTCEVACKQEHELPVGPRVVKVLERAPLFMQYYCHHCEDAPCALSCPEEAITKDPDTGVVLHDPEKCNGCALCTKPAHCGRYKRAIYMEGGVANIDEIQCLGCETCASICPMDAISMNVRP